MMRIILVKLNLLIIFMVLALAPSAHGTELFVPPISAKSGQLVDIPVKIDQVDNLAGVKLVVKYDVNALVFKTAGKTGVTSSLMHIVNSKTPGKLVIVMAGARGIKGKDIPIILLKFQVKKELKGKKAVQLKFSDIQLMDEKLRDIKYTVKINPLTISGDASSEPRKSDSPEKNGEKVKASEEEKDKSDKENDGKASDDKGEGQPADKEMKKQTDKDAESSQKTGGKAAPEAEKAVPPASEQPADKEMKKQTDKDAESSQKMGDTSSEPRKSDSPEKIEQDSEKESGQCLEKEDGKISDDKDDKVEEKPADKEMKKQTDKDAESSQKTGGKAAPEAEKAVPPASD